MILIQLLISLRSIMCCNFIVDWLSKGDMAGGKMPERLKVIFNTGIELG